MILLVDAANVVGSRPDGWWRDRAGAAGRLVRALAALTGEGDVVCVLEGAARPGAAEGDHDGVLVVHAPRNGDDELTARACPGTTVVTADRELRERCVAAGADVVGPRWLLERMRSPTA